MKQCGQCPMLLPDDMAEWVHHTLIVHDLNGYSVSEVKGDDWDIAELAGVDQ